MAQTQYQEEHKGYTVHFTFEELPTEFKIKSEIGKTVDEQFFPEHSFKVTENTFHKTVGMLNALNTILSERKEEIDKHLLND